MLDGLPLLRCRRLIDSAIDKLGVDLRGLTVLTEAATGYFILTPLIAALAGAERVLALTRDSVYGSASEVCESTMALASHWTVADRVQVLVSREDARVGNADIITNLGFVRPLDAPFLRRLKSTAVVSLMWETWEFRPEELDLQECRRLGIPVLGTDEHQPELRIFDYVGQVALKALYVAGFEVFRTRVCVVGEGEFAEICIDTLKRAGAEVAQLAATEAALHHPPAREAFHSAEAVILIDPHVRMPIFATHGRVCPKALARINPSLVILQLCGGADRRALEEAGLRCWPERFAAPGHMSVSTGFVGPRPVVDLHSAGLKVAQHLANARKRGLERIDAEVATLAETHLAQGFSG